MGLINILVRNVADVGDETEPTVCLCVKHGCCRRWVVLPFGQTLTKGNKSLRFQIQPVQRRDIDAWLNTPEENGGRPRGPSPFLLPSASLDNGQMSVSTLTRIFKQICKRAGFTNDPRAGNI